MFPTFSGKSHRQRQVNLSGQKNTNPFAAPFTQRAYHELVAAFLVQPDLSIFEAKLDLFAENIDVAELSSAVVAYYNSRSSHVVIGQGQELWLLAHFIGLVQTKRGGSRDSVSLKALYTQISYLSSQIKIGFPSAGEEAGQEAENGLPQYVFEQLQSLVTKEGISGLLDRFTTEHSANSGQELEDASLLAAYTLTIIRTFPSEYGEKILYPLVMTDIHTPRGDLPSIKFFWSAMSNTSVFDIIKSGDDATLDLLLRGKPRAGSTLQYGSKWDEEWRSILLFLELYVYVLKVTDDDDFFSGLGTSPMSHGAVESRVRKNCLALDDLLGLTLFLKHLAFTLLYNATQLHESELPSFATSRGIHKHHSLQTYSIISGIDYDSFSSIVTAAMRMLYERDSRRRFLPDGHWLMTSKFNMDSFMQAVIVEEERQRELKTKAEKDGDEDSDEESEADDDAMDSRPVGFMDQQSRRRMEYARNELQKRNKRAEQERKLAAAGPKIEILRKMPFAIPFETRVQIFRQFVLLDKERRRNGHVDADRWRLWVMSRTQDPFDPRGRQDNALARHEAKVKRGQVFNDAMDQFYQLGDGLKEPIQITFVDQFDTVEAGIDGGGVTKEFLMSVTKEAFTEQHNLMVANSRNAYYPNPCALDQRYELLRQARVPEGSPEWNESVNDLLKEYEFLGRIIGKCFYEGILIDIVFAPFFLLKWASAGSGAGYRGSINDLRDMDEELYQGLVNLEHHNGDISELEIDFTIEDQISFPGEPLRTETRNLLSSGENMIVTNENRPMYTRYVAMHRLAQQPRRQTAHFLKGLGAIIELGWLSMFNQSELQRLVGGDSSAIDVEDLRANTEYSGVYQIGDDGEEHPTIKMFWEVMFGLDDQERRDVLKYVTSTPRAPLLGFSQLRPPFTIRDGGQDQDRLPSASTCVNLLKLPQYKSAKRLKQKLLYAVTSGAGSPPSPGILKYVDPLIGTTNGGHVFPGASLPYGMAKAVADTMSIAENAAGFVSDNNSITGFSHMHDSGTGGNPSMGNFPLFVHPGCPDDDVAKCKFPQLERMTDRVNGSVAASPGYFSINLTNSVRAEMTVTEHVALYRFSFPGTEKVEVEDGKEVPYSPLVLVDLIDLANSRANGGIEVYPDTGRIIGDGTYSPSFGTGQYNAYFCADFRGAKMRRTGTFVRNEVKEDVKFIDGSEPGWYNPGGSTGAWVQFERPEKNDQIFARVGLSFISVDQACANAEREIPDFEFGKVQTAAREAWAKKLGAIEVDATGVSEEMQTTFWSGLYRTMLSPQNYTGENQGWNSTEPYYDSFYCIWDSFRAQHPLLTIIDPVAQTEMVRALVDIYRHVGKLPDCRMSFCKGFTQGGSNADIVLADAFVKNITDDINWDTAYEAVVSDAEVEPMNWGVEGRGNLVSWHELGYIPWNDEDKNGTGPSSRTISRSVEYAYDDFCIGLMAEGMGKRADARKYHARSANWQNLWNANQKDLYRDKQGDVVQSDFLGFLQPRLVDGTWRYHSTRACSPIHQMHSCYYDTALDTYEGSPWLYSFFVPQDMAGLVKAMGGRERFVERLTYFHTSGIAYMGNEQAFLTVFQFHYGGRPGLSSYWAHEYIPSQFNASVNGIPGNDDCAMGAFSAFVYMGFFPVAGQDVYLVTPPFFPEVKVRARNGAWAVIRVSNFDPTYARKYVRSATLNGRAYKRSWITHEFFMKGGVLELTVGEKEDPSWGTGEGDLPPSHPFLDRGSAG
ncbi:glycosyl hydrolase [Coniochaeta sp. 2T2.1]|nr:glycosyl hydrolase [Coniochaeta sp. 2T2.1]